jgi:SWI/SNF-related matrix-associated actin-dependent regulator of chromatin subfamily B protein 1
MRKAFVQELTCDLQTPWLLPSFKVPPQHFVSLIVSAIHQRVREFQDQVLPLVVRDRDRTACKGKLDPEGDGDAKAMIEVFRRAREGSEEIKTETDEGDGDGHVRIVGVDADEEMESDMGMGLEAERPMTVEEAMAECAKGPEGDDLRILIKVGHSLL